MSQQLNDSILEFSGNDARKVLQGQTTRNFESAPVGSSLKGAFCDIKGRVIADFCGVIVTDDRILLRVNDEVALTLQSNLQKYLMFSKTRLTILNWYCWGCISDSAVTDVSVIDGSVIDGSVKVPASGGYYEHWGEISAAPADCIPSDLWVKERLSRGEARITSATVGKYLPQDLNYDLLGLIDFDKGCYTGQEIIARLHYRGEPKRRLTLLSMSSEASVSAGEKLVDSNDGKTLGSVVEYSDTAGQQLCLCEAVTDIAQRSASICDLDAKIVTTFKV